MPFLRLSAAGLLTALAQISPSLAQNSSTNSTTQCPNADSLNWLSSEYATVNSTGQTSFRWTTRTPTVDLEKEGPWYMTVNVNDTGREPSAERFRRQNYISIPNNSGYDGVCVYSFMGINATAAGTGKNGCEGVLSDKCIDYMRKAILDGGASPSRCPPPYNASADPKEQEDACGFLMQNRAYTTKPFNASNQTCTLEKVPGINLPDNYHSREQGGLESPFAIESSGMAELPTYDMLVRQVVPFFVAATVYDDNSRMTDGDFVCVTPSDVKPGSRVPESEEPWETSAAGSNWQPSGISAMLFVGVVSTMLAL